MMYQLNIASNVTIDDDGAEGYTNLSLHQPLPYRSSGRRPL